MRRLCMFLGLLAVSAVLITGCVPPYDPAALAEAKQLKEVSLALLEKAVEPFTAHEPAVTALRARLDTALENNTAKKGNVELTDAWRELLDRESGNLGAILVFWETDGTLGAHYIKSASLLVEKSFDEIIRQEEARK